MKKALVFATFFAVSVVAQAETIRMHLAQDFAVTGSILPAGDYTLTPVASIPGVLLVKGVGVHAFVFGRLVPTGAQAQTLALEMSADSPKKMKNTALALALSPPGK